MEQKIKVYSATRGSVDGTNYSSTWCESEQDINQADTIGRPPMKINCASELIDQLRGQLPAMVVADMRMISGGGAKGGLFIQSIKAGSVEPLNRPGVSSAIPKV